MTTRVILVREVNVGGTARLPMAEFRAMLEELGAKNARTYIASGNALVDVTDDGPEACAQFDRSVERELEARFGFQHDVISRRVDELQAALDEYPFVTPAE